jgi:hypothetical protein
MLPLDRPGEGKLAAASMLVFATPLTSPPKLPIAGLAEKHAYSMPT